MCKTESIVGPDVAKKLKTHRLSGDFFSFSFLFIESASPPQPAVTSHLAHSFAPRIF